MEVAYVGDQPRRVNPSLLGPNAPQFLGTPAYAHTI